MRSTSGKARGDGWRGFQLFEFRSGTRRSVQGLVISNSCDVAPANPRDMPTRLTFAPLVKYASFEAALRASGIDKHKVE